MAGGIRDLLNDEVRAAAVRWGVSHHSAIFIEHASRGELRRTMPYVLDWLSTQRAKARDDTLSPEKLAALEATMPGWRRLRPAEIDRAWAQRNGAPLPPRHRRRKKKPRPAPAQPSPATTPKPAPGNIQVAATPSEVPAAAATPEGLLRGQSLRVPESSPWMRVIKAAQGGTLSLFQGAFRSLRAQAAEGVLPTAETVAMDQAAPGWRSTSAEVLDANWQARNEPPRERPRPATADSRGTEDGPERAYAKSYLSTADRVILTALEAGKRDTETDEWLDNMLALLAQGKLKPQLVARMEALAPGWAGLRPALPDRPGDSAPAPGAPPVLTIASNPPHDRRVAAVVALATTTLVDEIPEVASLLARFRSAAERGELAQQDRAALDAALPGWRGSAVASPKEGDATASPQPQPTKRSAFVEDFDQRSLDMLQLADRGELATAGMTAVNWLIRERSRDQDGRLAPHITARYAQVIPGWRDTSPLKLDKAWRERLDWDAF